MFPGSFGPSSGGGEDALTERDLMNAAAAAQGGDPLGQGSNMNELMALAGMLSGQDRGMTGDNADDEEEDEIDSDDIEETITERLIGLTEMFPSVVRSFMASAIGGTASAIKWTWINGQSFLWAVTATSMVAVMPVMLERERHQFQQEQLAQQRQMLLGPGAASPGATGHSMYGGLVPPGLSAGGK